MNEPEVINDFSFRAVHASAELGKQVVQQYYSRSAAKSYYTACSNGGRQGMQAALLYPQDFDGILAGSPAVDFNHLLGWLAILGRDVGAPNGNSSSSFIPDALWPVVSAAIMEQCDLLDGVADQMLTEPDDCFDPSVFVMSALCSQRGQRRLLDCGPDCIVGEDLLPSDQRQRCRAMAEV